MTTYSDAARNAACDAVVDLLNGGALVLMTAADVVVVSLPLSDPAFGDAAAGEATAGAIAETAATSAGTVSKAQLRTSGDAVLLEMTVTGDGGGGDIEMPGVTFAVDELVRVNSLSLTQPAS